MQYANGIDPCILILKFYIAFILAKFPHRVKWHLKRDAGSSFSLTKCVM